MGKEQNDRMAKMAAISALARQVGGINNIDSDALATHGYMRIGPGRIAPLGSMVQPEISTAQTPVSEARVGVSTRIVRRPRRIAEITEPDPVTAEVIAKVSRYIGDIWNREDYPPEKLLLTQEEQEIVQKRQSGDTYTQIAEEDSFDNKQIPNSKARLAEAKLELQGNERAKIEDLSQPALSMLLLNSVFGEKWKKSNFNVRLISLSLTALVGRFEFYDLNLPKEWRKTPNILFKSPSKSEKRIEQLNEWFGSRWTQGCLNLLTLATTTLEKRVEIYDHAFGSTWRSYPKIMLNNPDTIFTSVRALLKSGITPDNVFASVYYSVLTTSLELKKRKARAIRECLGHKHIYINHEKMTKDELARQKKARTIEDQAAADREVREFNLYLKGGKLSLMNQSLATLRNMPKMRQPKDKPQRRQKNPQKFVSPLIDKTKLYY